MPPFDVINGRFLDWFFALVSKKRRRRIADRKLVTDSGLFSSEYYSTTYPDVSGHKLAPLDHFLRIGGFNGRNPSAGFDTRTYLSEHPHVAVWRINPLLHYLRHDENRVVGPHRLERFPARSNAPRQEDWSSLAALQCGCPSIEVEIDIIVPIYRGYDESLTCLYRLLRSSRRPAANIIVINDGSPDERLSRELRRLSSQKYFSLTENEHNIGYVESINIAIRQHPERDVVLLNSDTEVFGDWLRRLKTTAYAESRIGTVTPLSNNATICSYPYICRNNVATHELSYSELDDLTASTNSGEFVELPTAVGFCMYIRRDCLDEVGSFDAARFGKGYGEENDFSRRASELGWKNVLAGDVFVRHIGHVSFGNDASQLLRKAAKTVEAMHPGYHDAVTAFVDADPALKLRRRLDIARLARHTRKRTILVVTHNSGGGTQRHVNDMQQRLSEEGICVLFLTPLGNSKYAVLSHPQMRYLPNINPIDIGHDLARFANLIRALSIDHLHIHHLLGFDARFPSSLAHAAKHAGVKYDFSVHDYTALCPRITMIDDSGVYCDKGGLAECDRCISKNGSPFGNVSMHRWRKRYRLLLREARRVFVFDEDTRDRLSRVYPHANYFLRRHPEAPVQAIEVPVERKPDESLRVAVIGALGAHKGSEVILRCARHAKRHDLEIEFVIFGVTASRHLAKMPNVCITGNYRDDRIHRLLREYRCHIAFFASVWPETYSYTLSIAFRSGLFPVAFDVGAIASRITQTGWGMILPLSLSRCPDELTRALLACEPAPPPPADKLMKTMGWYADLANDYYGLDWDDQKELLEFSTYRK